MTGGVRVLEGFRNLDVDWEAAALTIGNFDGVHRGHQAVIGAAVEAARDGRLRAVVCTFDPHTSVVLRPDEAPPLLQTRQQKLRAFAELGVDVVVVIPFDDDVAAVSPEDFLQGFLVGEARAKRLFVSESFTFGRGGAGDLSFLQERAPRHDLQVIGIPARRHRGRRISSSWVREAVTTGDVATARELLGRPFALVGEVVRGAGRGEELDAPTANLRPDNELLPGTGVYVTEARRDGASHPSVTNVGVRPTFDDANELVVEAHLLDFEGELYGESLELAFLERLRDEVRFESAEQLARQIGDDIEAARSWFRTAPG